MSSKLRSGAGMLSWLTLVAAIVGSSAGSGGGVVVDVPQRFEHAQLALVDQRRGSDGKGLGAPMAPSLFWLYHLQVGGAQGLCQNISRQAPDIDNGNGNGSQIFYPYYGRLPVLDYPPKTTPGHPSWCNGRGYHCERK